MATTLSTYPSTVSLNDWSHISDAYAPSNNYATAAPGRNSSKVAHLGNFVGTSIPSNSTITSCTIEAKYHVSTLLSTPTLQLAVLNDDVQKATPSRFAGSPTTDVTVTHTCATVTTPAETADGTFEVEVIAERGDDTDAVLFSLDYVKATFVFSANLAQALTGNAATAAAGTLAVTLGTTVNSTLSGIASTADTNTLAIGSGAAIAVSGGESTASAQVLDAGQWYTGELGANAGTGASGSLTATWGSGITLDGV